MPSETASLTVVEWTTAAWALVLADDPAEIRRLETLLDCTQSKAVSHYIEDSCWGEDLADFVGGKGTPQDRRFALLALWKDYQGMGHNA